MSTYIPESLRTRISETDRQRCCYCLTSEVNSGIPMTHDHINPRIQAWSEHFEWSPDGTKVTALTAVGRATIAALRMNNPIVVSARRRWAIGGWHPPDDE
jgi:hypothetical protein